MSNGVSDNFRKKQLFNKYQKQLALFLTDQDIKTALNCEDDKIIKYSDLAEFDCFCKLLPSNTFDFRVVLVEQKENVGHFVCIVKQNNNIYLFDPYGCPIDKELSFVDKAQRILLGEDKRLVERLINKCNCEVNIYENNNQFQSLKEGVSCCGRWCVLFIEMCKMGYDIDEFSKFIFTASENEGKPTDILVCDWIKVASDFKERDDLVSPLDMP
jgi:hypothetical protein